MPSISERTELSSSFFKLDFSPQILEETESRLDLITELSEKHRVDADELPGLLAREMLEEHFPKSRVSMIKVDKHLLRKTDYDVKLTDGTKIEFNNKGRWTSVDCGKKTVPESLVAKAIRNYIAKNYSGSNPVSITKKNAGYDIGLSCGRTLRFNLLHQFKGEKKGPGGNQ